MSNMFDDLNLERVDTKNENFNNIQTIEIKNEKIAFLGCNLYENNITKENINYDIILKNQELYESFYRHAKKNLSANNLLFLKEVEELINMNGKSDCKKKAKSIIKKYIKCESFHEINTDKEKKYDVVLGIDKCKKKEDYVKLFDKIYNEIKMNINQDLVYSYTTTNSFKKIRKKINKKEIEMIEDLTIYDVADYIKYIFDNSNFGDESLGEKYGNIFQENEINGVCLKYIDDNYLEKFGITIIGHQIFILENIKQKLDDGNKTKNASFCTIF